MGNLGLTFQVEKDSKNIRRYQEETSDGPPIVEARATFNSGRCAI